MIELENVSFAYQGQKALDGVNCQMEMGKCYVIQGPNGSGKSTLFRILNGLDFPTTGRFLFDGEEITAKKMKRAEYAKNFHKQIGFIFQNSEIQLFTRSVEDEIAFGLNQLGLEEKEIQQRVEKYIGTLHLSELRTRAPFNLSGGEKKRVALAAVLAMEPRVLILDEPLSGLDEEGQQWVEAFIESVKSPERLIIIATHNHDLADRIADVKLTLTKAHTLV